MLGFPKVVKGISCFQLAPRNEERLDQAPNFPALAWKLAEKNPRIGDVDVVTPGTQLHGEQLLGREGANEKRRPTSGQEYLAYSQ
jgi:hypothetical protein